MPIAPTTLNDATKRRLAKAALDALRHSGLPSFMAPLPGVDPPAFVAVGSAPSIESMARSRVEPLPELLTPDAAQIQTLAEDASQVGGDAFVAFPWDCLTPGEQEHFLRMTRALTAKVAKIAAEVADRYQRRGDRDVGAEIRAHFGV